MDEDATATDAKGIKADHLCILVHGLWGNPSHLANFAQAVRARYPAEQLHILIAKSNSGSSTYDGIDIGGERLAHEIEAELTTLESQGHRITKLSIIGYSLGGLVARYCIGLLYSRGLFKRLQPVTFSAFASPFLGVGSPRPGSFSSAYDAVASRMVAASGRQLFLADSYRDSGRPLLEVMTDPQSIFVAGLKRFENRTVYANAVNDLSAPWFTSGFTRIDPFTDLDAVRLNYMPGHDAVLLDPTCPVQWKDIQLQGVATRMYNYTASLAANMPFYLLVAMTLPMALTFVLLNCIVQMVFSSRRVRLHRSSPNGGREWHALPYLLETLRETIAEVATPSDDSDLTVSPAGSEKVTDFDMASVSTDATCLSEPKPSELQGRAMILPLDERRLRMIENLDAIGFHKYPVYISKARQSHAAIIARKNWKNMAEGFVVIQHWLDHEFKI